MKNFTTITGFATRILIVLILISGKLSSQTEILGHTYGGSLNGHSYYISDCSTTWVQAQDAATQMGGYLVAIASEAENEIISEFAPVMFPTDPNGSFEIYGGAWTGLVATDNNGTCGFWQWVNGETVVFTNWPIGSDEPVYTNCGIPIVIGLCSTGWCAQSFQFGWLTEGYNSSVRKYIVEFNSDPGCSNINKTYVCHNGNTICVNQSSLQNHLDHGDYAGPCSPCNSSYAVISPDIEVMDGHDLAGLQHAPGTDVSDHSNLLSGTSEMILYPNPGRDEIKIGLPSDFISGVLKVFTLRGEQIALYGIKSVGTTQVDISSLPPGMYIFDLRSEAGSWQKKFIRAE